MSAQVQMHDLLLFVKDFRETMITLAAIAGPVVALSGKLRGWIASHFRGFLGRIIAEENAKQSSSLEGKMKSYEDQCSLLHESMKSVRDRVDKLETQLNSLLTTLPARIAQHIARNLETPMASLGSLVEHLLKTDATVVDPETASKK